MSTPFCVLQGAVLICEEQSQKNKARTHTFLLQPSAARRLGWLRFAEQSQDTHFSPPAISSAAAWLAPLRHCVPYSEATAKLCPGPLSLDDYLTLVDETGRLIRSDKRGAIPAHLAPILARLDLDLDIWLGAMCSSGRFFGGAIGSAAACAAEALRRGVKWVVDRTKIHKPPAAA